MGRDEVCDIRVYSINGVVRKAILEKEAEGVIYSDIDQAKEVSMKKLAIVLLLAALLLGMLAGCGGSSPDLDNYQALVQEMSELSEYRFRGDITLFLEPALLRDSGFLFADLMPMRFSVDGTVSYMDRMMQAAYRYRQADGTPLFDMDMILGDGAMYVGLVSLLDFMLRPIFAELGFDLSEFSVEDLLEGYEYLIVPYGEMLEDMVFAPVDVLGGIDVEPFLSRRGNAFVVTVLGEDVRALAGEMSEMLAQFVPREDAAVAGGGNPVGGVVGDVGMLLMAADLTHARAIVVTSRVEDTFYQTVELVIPGVLDLRAEFAFTAEAVPLISAPTNALTEDAFAELLMRIDFEAIFGPSPVGPGEVLDISIAYDLEALYLVGHSLDEGSLLQIVMLGDGRGGEHPVAAIYGSRVTAGEHYIFCDADAMEMRYVSLDHLNAVEVILQAVETDRAGYFMPDSRLTVSALRTNESRSIAAMAILERTAAGLARICIYLGEVLPAGGVIRLELVLYLDLFTELDHAILDELSRHIGLDLGDYVTRLLGSA